MALSLGHHGSTPKEQRPSQEYVPLAFVGWHHEPRCTSQGGLPEPTELDQYRCTYSTVIPPKNQEQHYESFVMVEGVAVGAKG